MATVTWKGVSGNWNVGTNWVNNAKPGNTDTAAATTSVVGVTDTEGVGSLDFSGSSELLINGGDLDVGAGVPFLGTDNMSLGSAGAVLTGSNSVLEVGSSFAGTAAGTIHLQGTNSEFLWDPARTALSDTNTAANSTGLTVDFADAGNGAQFDLSANFDGTINGFQAGDSIKWADANGDTTGFTDTISANQVVLKDAGGNTLTIKLSGGPYNSTNLSVSSAGVITTSFTCFVTGTQIRTSHGDVAVEHLKVGDVAITHDGRQKPISWIGRRKVRCSRQPNPSQAWPVRVRKDTFGKDMPYADLWLSPNHSLCLEDCLVPVRGLVDGDRIASVERETVTYWHVEVEGHDVLMANGVPAESYLDTGNRRFFDDAATVPLHFDESPAPGYDGSGYCLPLIESGPRLSAIRARWLGRDEPSEARETVETKLVADEVVLTPCFASADELRFFIPAGTAELRLSSPSFVSEGDIRRLGVSVRAIQVSDGSGWRAVDLDDPGLYAGFHATERNAQGEWRWTDGEGHISPAIWADGGSGVLLRFVGSFAAAPAPAFADHEQRAAA